MRSWIVAMLVCAGCAVDGLDESTVEQPVLVPAVWTQAVGVTATDNDLLKTGTPGWNAGAVSVASIAGDGAVEFTTSEATGSKMLGLSNGNPGQGYPEIDFALYLTLSPAIGAMGHVKIYEQGTERLPDFGTYAPGQTFRIDVRAGVVRYYRDGVLLYTSKVAPTFPLLVDTSFNHPGGTLSDVTFGEDTWTNDLGVALDGSSLTKTGAAGWNAGASTVRTLPAGDVKVEFTTAETNRAKMVGLSNGDTSRHFDDIDFATFLTSTGKVQVYEGGVLRGTFGSYLAGDVFRVAVTRGTVGYFRNGVSFYTSGLAPTFPILVDTSLNQTGATVRNVFFEQTFWKNPVGVAIDGYNLTSNGGGVSGASTIPTITGDGYAEFTNPDVIGQVTAKAAGLNSDDTGTSSLDLDFGFNLTKTGQLQVVESGVVRGTFGAATAGDVYRIEVTAGVVRYFRNTGLVYTSTVTPAPTLAFDTSFARAGGRITGVIVVDTP